MFIERDYTIDFINKFVKFDDVGVSFIRLLLDFFGNVMLHMLVYGFFAWIFLLITDKSEWFIPIILVLFVGFVLFSLGYMFSDKKIWTDMQLFLELPLSFLFDPFQKKKVFIVDEQDKIVLNFRYYWRYELLLYGDCKRFIKKISYRKIGFCRRELLIEFTESVIGKIVLKYRGELIEK